MTWLVAYLIGAGLSLLLMDAWVRSPDGQEAFTEQPLERPTLGCAMALYAALWPITVAWGLVLCLWAFWRGEFADTEEEGS